MKGGETINTVLNQVESIIDKPYILFGLLFLLAATNLFFPPIPLETATLFAGYLAGAGRGSLTVIITATTGGMVSSSLILYLLIKTYQANLLKRPFFQKSITRSFYKKSRLWFHKYGLYALFLGKIIPGMGLSTIIYCGVLKLNPKKIIPAIFVSNFLLYSILALTGSFLGENWGTAIPWFSRVGEIALILVGFFAVGALVYFLIKKRNYMS